MGYDLFLKSDKLFTFQDFNGYFTGKNNYNVEGNQAFYKNIDTGVDFHFEFQEEDFRLDNEEIYPVAFYMNYFRPSFFAFEAEPELKNFINTFCMKVNDPQNNGMGIGNYSSEKFLEGWNNGNEFGYKVALQQKDINQHTSTLPSDTLRSVWEWNYNRKNLQNRVEHDVFVPKITILTYQNKVSTAIAWPDAIPSIIPKVDILVIGRKKFAARNLFRKKEDMCIGYWTDFESFFKKYKLKMENNGYYIYYEKVPKEIKKALISLPTYKTGLTALPCDSILDEELVKKYGD